MTQAQLTPASPGNASPRPFKEIPGLWLRAFRMTKAFFAQEAPRATALNTLISMLILGVGVGLVMFFGLLTSDIYVSLKFQRHPVGSIAGRFGVLTPAVVAVTLLAFYPVNSVAWMGARILGGRGALHTQLYVQSLFLVPLTLVAGVASVMPMAYPLVRETLGPQVQSPLELAHDAVWFFALICAGLLNVRAVEAVHQLTRGRAIAVSASVVGYALLETILLLRLLIGFFNSP